MRGHAKAAWLHTDLVRLGLGQHQELTARFEPTLAGAAGLVVHPVSDDAHDVHEAAFQGPRTQALGRASGDGTRCGHSF